MRKNLIFLVTLTFFSLPTSRIFAEERVRTCGSGPRYEQLAEERSFQQRMAAIFSEARHQYALVSGPPDEAPPILEIPIVVHVLFNVDDKGNPTESNISDAQVRSQLTVLNRDFDPPLADAQDVTKIPLRFANLFGALRLRYVFATKDPKGKATNGIVRVRTKLAKFISDTDDAKDPARGGDAPWDRDRYLNIWVVPDLTTSNGLSLFGYASFPSEPAAADGVVIWYRAFGTTEAVQPKYDSGRTATHEIGHWLGLHHLWGDRDSNADCLQDDGVADTPKQAEPNYKCPSGVHISCNNDPDGDLFMNYMDYPEDACMTFFSQGQAAVARATMKNARNGLGREVAP